MILCLLSNSASSIADELEYEEALNGTLIQKMVGRFDFPSFVRKDFAHYAHVTELVVELSCLEVDGSLLESLKQFQMLYDARVTLIDLEGFLDESIIETLCAMGITNLVMGDDMREIKSDLLLSVTSGLTRYLGKSNSASSSHFSLPSSFGMRISVLGASRRVGATTLSVSLARFLASLGASAVYSAQEQMDLVFLAREVGASETGENSFDLDGLSMRTHISEGAEAVLIADGFLQEGSRLIGVCGHKYTEAYETRRFLSRFPEVKTLVLVHTPESDREEIKEHFESHGYAVFFMEHQDAIGEWKKNESMLIDLMQHLISQPERT